MRRSEEPGAFGPQRLIGRPAIRHAQRHRVADQVGVGGRLEDHGGLVGARSPRGSLQPPGLRVIQDLGFSEVTRYEATTNGRSHVVLGGTSPIA
jgi:hypothetical protein